MDEGRIFDEHLLPGHGSEPVAEVLEYLVSQDWHGSVVAEVNTRKARTEDARLELLRETLAFAQAHLGTAHRKHFWHPRPADVVGAVRRAGRRALAALRSSN